MMPHRLLLRLSLLALLALLAPRVPGAALKVANRAPLPNEWGYRPAEGAAAVMNPPSLTWIHQKEAAAYTVQIAPGGDFAQAITAGPLPFNVYTHNKPLQPGNYAWRYKFADKKGQQSDWSVVRHFTVGPDAIDFPMPSRAEQTERVPQQHPRLFMRPEDLPRLRQAIKSGEAATRYAKVKREADRLLKQKPTPEPKIMGAIRNEATRDAWWPNRVTALKAGDECETLAFVYLMTGEKKYGEAARKFIMAYAAWNPDGPTNFSLNDEAAFPPLYKLPRAYDWAYGALSEADRAAVRKVMLRRATDVWKSGQVGYGPGHLNSPYSSHPNRCWHKLAECALAFYGELPQATDWLDFAVNKFYAAYPVWSDDDGGWHEGASYSEGYMVKIVWWLAVAKSALQIDGFKKPYFSQVGDFLMYMAPPGSPNMGMGDLSYHPQGRGAGGYLEMFCRAMNGPEQHGQYWQWWKQQWKMSGQEGILGVLYAINMPAEPEAKIPTSIPQSKVFHGIGQASLHTNLFSAADDVHFHFKSSPMGSQSHGHNPQNSFQLTAYGETLLAACTYRDYHGSKFHYEWVHQTSSQNAVLVDGKGQVIHSSAPLGKIVTDKLTPEVDYVVGDAAAAYEGRLTRCLRHVVFVKPDFIVLYDDLAAKEPATFQFMLHGLSPFKIDEGHNVVQEAQPKAQVAVQYLSPLPLTFKQTDGFNPKPTKPFPNLWHVEAGTSEKAKELGMLTVLVPSKSGQASDFTSKRIESATALGVRIERGSKTTLVAFRKPGVTGAAELDGVKFDDAMTVKKQ